LFQSKFSGGKKVAQRGEKHGYVPEPFFKNPGPGSKRLSSAKGDILPSGRFKKIREGGGDRQDELDIIWSGKASGGQKGLCPNPDRTYPRTCDEAFTAENLTEAMEDTSGKKYGQRQKDSRLVIT